MLEAEVEAAKGRYDYTHYDRAPANRPDPVADSHAYLAKLGLDGDMPGVEGFEPDSLEQAALLAGRAWLSQQRVPVVDTTWQPAANDWLARYVDDQDPPAPPMLEYGMLDQRTQTLAMHRSDQGGGVGGAGGAAVPIGPAIQGLVKILARMAQHEVTKAAVLVPVLAMGNRLLGADTHGGRYHYPRQGILYEPGRDAVHVKGPERPMVETSRSSLTKASVAG